MLLLVASATCSTPAVTIPQNAPVGDSPLLSRTLQARALVPLAAQDQPCLTVLDISESAQSQHRTFPADQSADVKHVFVSRPGVERRLSRSMTVAFVRTETLPVVRISRACQSFERKSHPHGVAPDARGRAA
jgi:hypothetical protein